MKTRVRKLLLGGLVCLTFICLVSTYSRSSLGAFLIILLFAFRGMKLGKRLVSLFTVAVLLVLLLVVNASFYQRVYGRFVLKRSDSLLDSRRYQLGTSWVAATKGGVWGLGFGVSESQSKYWTFGSFSEASREKGSSQMAVLEESGIAGFAFYMLFLCSAGMVLSTGNRNPNYHFLGSVSFGFFLAALFHSMFEAWFLSTGPEAAFFWAGLGLCVGRLDDLVPAIQRPRGIPIRPILSTRSV